MSSMFQMKEEVETQFTDRMEQLRDMYKGELYSQSEKLEEEKAKSKELEEILRQEIGNIYIFPGAGHPKFRIIQYLLFALLGPESFNKTPFTITDCECPALRIRVPYAEKAVLKGCL